MRGTIIIWLLTIALACLATAAYAHNVTVFGWLEGDTIHTQSKFSGGKRVRGGTIEVFNRQRQKLLEGVTDDQGRFAFPRPEGVTELIIELTAGMGHAGRWVMGPEDLGGSTTMPLPAADKPTPVLPKETHGLSMDAIEAMVERTIQKELAPLKAQLAGQTWGFRDILAGIGYILGLMGLASYVQYRKDRRK